MISKFIYLHKSPQINEELNGSGNFLLLLHSRSPTSFFWNFGYILLIVFDRQRLIFLKFCLNTVLLWCATIRYTLCTLTIFQSRSEKSCGIEINTRKKISWYCTRVEMCGAGCIIASSLNISLCLLVCLSFCLFLFTVYFTYKVSVQYYHGMSWSQWVKRCLSTR